MWASRVGIAVVWGVVMVTAVACSRYTHASAGDRPPAGAHPTIGGVVSPAVVVLVASRLRSWGPGRGSVASVAWPTTCAAAGDPGWWGDGFVASVRGRRRVGG